MNVELSMTVTKAVNIRVIPQDTEKIQTSPRSLKNVLVVYLCFKL